MSQAHVGLSGCVSVATGGEGKRGLPREPGVDRALVHTCPRVTGGSVPPYWVSVCLL